LVIPLAYGGSFAAQKVMETLGLPMHQQELTNLFTNAESPLHLYCLTFMAVVVAPLGEEVIFRAGLFRILLRFAPRWAALLISGSVFAASHANTMHLLPLTILGIVFALAYERTGSLVVPVVAHGLFNLNTITMLLAGLAGSP
jgi:membrane protease YdiL (CAAX protease family)